MTNNVIKSANYKKIFQIYNKKTGELLCDVYKMIILPEIVAVS